MEVAHVSITSHMATHPKQYDAGESNLPQKNTRMGGLDGRHVGLGVPAHRIRHTITDDDQQMENVRPSIDDENNCLDILQILYNE